MKTTCLRKSFIGKCFKIGDFKSIEHKFIGGVWPQPEIAPDPSLVIWPNLGVGKLSRMFRSFIVYLISLGIIGVSFLFIIELYLFKQKYDDDNLE